MFSDKTLHIVSSNSTVEAIRSSEVKPTANFLVWGDGLAMGPVLNLGLESLSNIRRRYLIESGKVKFFGDDGLPQFETRDRLVRQCSQWSELVLWFGPQVEEQLALAQIVTVLGEELIPNSNVTLATSSEGVICEWGKEELRKIYQQRVSVPDHVVRFCSDAWMLYGEQDPQNLHSLIYRYRSVYPGICSAFLHQLREFPAVGSGLATSECDLLNRVPECKTVARIVAHAMFAHGSNFFNPPLLFERMWNFLVAKPPMIEPIEGAVDEDLSFKAFTNLVVRLTPTARRVLDEGTDYVGLCGVDRWIGGVHLRGTVAPWRWDNDAQNVRKL